MKAFNAPIPGQSLTTAPKNFAWERPPEITDPEEAIQMHITRLTDPKKLSAVLDLIEVEGLDVHTLTKGIMRGAVANGIHSIDVGLLAAPVVHEYIKQAAKHFGLNPDDGFEDATAEEEKRRGREIARAKKILQEKKPQTQEAFKETKQERVEDKSMPRRGLMSKGDM